MNELLLKIIELRNFLDNFISQELVNNTRYFSRITNETESLVKINRIIDIINLGYYNEKDCLKEIFKVLTK